MGKPVSNAPNDTLHGTTLRFLFTLYETIGLARSGFWRIFPNFSLLDLSIANLYLMDLFSRFPDLTSSCSYHLRRFSIIPTAFMENDSGISFRLFVFLAVVVATVKFSSFLQNTFNLQAIVSPIFVARPQHRVRHGNARARTRAHALPHTTHSPSRQSISPHSTRSASPIRIAIDSVTQGSASLIDR